jgi:7-carboxy-7-deazaguanine synthase
MRMPTVPDTERFLVLNEMFGPTFQGEGPSIGQYARFIRLFGCHLSCGWCDSAQTHDARRYDLNAEQQIVPVQDVLDWLKGTPIGLVVITGGEPLLQPRALEALVGGIRSDGSATEIEVETSGTIEPTPEFASGVARFNVSPKLAHSGLRERQRIRPDVLKRFAGMDKTRWKFVVQDLADLDEVALLVAEYGFAPVWIMPEGVDSLTVLERMRLLAKPVLEHGWHLSTRLHTLLWDNERAR